MEYRLLTNIERNKLISCIVDTAEVSVADLAAFTGTSVSTIMRYKRGEKISMKFFNHLIALALLGHYKFNSQEKLKIDIRTVVSGILALTISSLSKNKGVVSRIPAIIGIAGYSLVKAIKEIAKANKLRIKEVDNHFEFYAQ